MGKIKNIKYDDRRMSLEAAGSSPSISLLSLHSYIAFLSLLYEAQTWRGSVHGCSDLKRLICSQEVNLLH